MQTNLTKDQLKKPDIAEMEAILRKCVHCGFCLPVCPTYNLLGDERDSPRGRIYLIKELLESDGKNIESVVPHVDKCLSCLACTSVCPSGVDYQHYIDFAREYIGRIYKRPFFDRMVRSLLLSTISNPTKFWYAIVLANFVRPISFLFGRMINSIIKFTPTNIGPRPERNGLQVFPATGSCQHRVALLAGCAQQTLRPSITQATVRLLCRLGCEVTILGESSCCGALAHHMGDKKRAHDSAKSNINSWTQELEKRDLEAIIVNASGCGTQVKDYAYMFRNDENWSLRAQKISNIAKDISEFVVNMNLPKQKLEKQFSVVYHDACSLLHGQKVYEEPRKLLEKGGFIVHEVPGDYYCCGSAGIYNLLQTEISNFLKGQRVKNIQEIESDFVATGNIGCLVQLEASTSRPVVHTVELLDWATGGPRPSNI